ncbi:hypothetical protein HID58_076280 [Brassica napus]|uniref:Dof-type domain-containing protein n=1 Tax=Brassica napus TaxID=3708 RepID=A0ABQ7YMB4_BRANA|nr:hypothetical protein HID58_076280 [Brassica napus]
MDEEKPPPQSLSQPRYTCKNCRRLLTHGGTLRTYQLVEVAVKPTVQG